LDKLNICAAIQQRPLPKSDAFTGVEFSATRWQRPRPFTKPLLYRLSYVVSARILQRNMKIAVSFDFDSNYGARKREPFILNSGAP